LNRVRNNDPKIKEIDITVGDDERMQMLCNALRENKTVTKLLMGYSELSGTKHLEQLSEALEVTKIRSLNLRNCRIGAEGVKVLLSRGIMSSLSFLDLRYNELGDNGVIILSNAVQSKKAGGLKTLLLAGCNISDEGAEALSEFVMKGLEELDLSANQIGNEGIDALTQAMIVMGEKCKITALELRENRIGDKGAISISLALASTKHIRNLNLSKNEIGNEGCELMAHVLSTRKSLVRLNLHSNRIDNQGALYFLQVLKNHNDKLLYLDLSRNNAITKSTRQGIIRLLDSNKSGVIREFKNRAKKKRIERGLLPNVLKSISCNGFSWCSTAQLSV